MQDLKHGIKINHNILRRIRKDMQLTQEDAAKMIGISRISLNNFESGKSHPATRSLLKICRAYDVPVHILTDPEVVDICDIIELCVRALDGRLVVAGEELKEDEEKLVRTILKTSTRSIIEYLDEEA